MQISLLQRATRWFASRNGSTMADSAEKLRLSRHAKFCTALPFPELKWSTDQQTRHSLTELRDYAAQLANSALDWYLQKKTYKKRFAQSLHFLTFAFATAAAVIPLAKISTLLDYINIKPYVGSDITPSSLAAEITLVLIGIAGGFNLIDRSLGFSADWMRYIVTASKINRALIDFQLQWNELEFTAPVSTTKSAAKTKQLSIVHEGRANLQQTSNGNNNPQANPIARRIELVNKFCMTVIDLTYEETSIWSDELTDRVAKMASHLPGHGRP